MTKNDRQRVFDKYGGKCAYCGDNLSKGWHVDHLEPVRRNYERVGGTTILANGEWTYEPPRTIEVEPCHPERDCFDNWMPACPSCNINKHSGSLEDFRRMIAKFIDSLNRYSVQYKIAKRYRLVTETIKPVVFYFEQAGVKKLTEK